jgi:hypothetical protein
MSVYIETGFTGETYPLTHGRLCWDWYADGTYSASSAAAGFPAANALPPRTDSAWGAANTTATLEYNFSTSRVVSFLGFAKHTLGGSGATLSLQYKVGSTWSFYAGGTGIEPADDSPLLFLASERTVNGVRILITAADTPVKIGVFMAGVTDEWPRPFVWTGQPITEGDQIQFENTISMTGNWLGRSKVSDGLAFDLTMNNAPETWRQGAFKAFKAYANGGDAAMFVAPRPAAYPDEVSYAWASNVVTAERSQPNKAISTSVTLQMQGLRPLG